MSFVLRIDAPVHIEDYDYQGDHVLMCRVGIDPDAQKVYFAAVGLDPIGDDAPEYWFGIIEHDVLTGEDKIRLSGRNLVGVIPPDDRNAILGAICGLTAQLLDLCKPRKVKRMTHDAYQHGKGIEKHEVISRVFMECGYDVTKCDSWYGRRAWICELIGQNPVEDTLVH